MSREKINERLSQLFFESVTLEDRKAAAGSFCNLMNLVVAESQVKRDPDYYDEFLPQINGEKGTARLHSVIKNYLISGFFDCEELITKLYDDAIKEMPWYSEEVFTGASILKVTIEDFGYQGGNSSHGGFVEINLINEAATVMYINEEMVDRITIRFEGDSERENLLSSLKWLVERIEDRNK